MSLNDIDQYLDHCEAVLLRDRHPIPDTTFPLRPSTSIPADIRTPRPGADFHTSSTVDRISQSPVPSDTKNKMLPLMPGEKIKSYDAHDITGILPLAYEIVLDAAAQMVGVEQVDVARVVKLYERRLEIVRLGGDGRGRNR
jgi:hypothetical protein